MAQQIQVVLREDVDNLGHTGEVVKVRPGYARNYLVPRGLAVMATRGNLKQIEHEAEAARKRGEKLRSEAQGVAAALAEVEIQVEKQVGEEGKLYGSVTSADIAKVLQDKGYSVDKRKIQMPKEPIKQVGRYEVSAKLAAGIEQSFQVEVVSAEQ